MSWKLSITITSWVFWLVAYVKAKLSHLSHVKSLKICVLNRCTRLPINSLFLANSKRNATNHLKNLVFSRKSEQNKVILYTYIDVPPLPKTYFEQPVKQKQQTHSQSFLVTWLGRNWNSTEQKTKISIIVNCYTVGGWERNLSRV